MKIYFDSCCFSRPFDDVNQSRVSDEGEAITAIIKIIKIRGYILLGSEISSIEISEMTDIEKKNNSLMMYSYVDHEIMLNNQIMYRAQSIQNQSSIKQLDSIHLASAEYGGADIFITTDDRLVRRYAKIAFRMRVLNPVSYLQELNNA